VHLVSSTMLPRGLARDALYVRPLSLEPAHKVSNMVEWRTAGNRSKDPQGPRFGLELPTETETGNDCRLMLQAD
jgi:hypothetical protein